MHVYIHIVIGTQVYQSLEKMERSLYGHHEHFAEEGRTLLYQGPVEVVQGRHVGKERHCSLLPDCPKP